MRDTIRRLLEKTIIFKYHLPTDTIPKTDLSTMNDECYSVASNTDLANLIYNGISEYAVGEKHVDISKLQIFQTKAIKKNLRYEDKDSESTKLKYGFYGEVVLDLILQHRFNSSVLLAKGHFYSPLEKSEPKGYDAYQFYYEDNQLVLLLGEVKFYERFSQAVDNILSKLTNATSEEYFNTNYYALIKEKNNFDSQSKEINEVIAKWEENPEINLYDEVKKHNVKLLYPMLILYDAKKDDYNEVIRESIETINRKIKSHEITNKMKVELFFILIPVESSKVIKENVIKWITSNKPLEQ